MQIRGYKVRLPLDLYVVASANPEDYTNRGRIITPLKDRFGSQIRTHYPRRLEDEIAIMEAERTHFASDGVATQTPDYMSQVVAELTQLARKASEINQRSGVSVRVSICNYENLVSNALKRAIRLGEREAAPRVSDLGALVASTSGKIELETLGETSEDKVLGKLMQRAVLNVFNRRFKTAELEEVVKGFEGGLRIDVSDSMPVGGLRPPARTGEGAGGRGVAGSARGSRQHRLRGGVRPGGPSSEPQAQQGRPVGRSVPLPRLTGSAEAADERFHLRHRHGGTFTDCVVIDAGGRIVTAKAPSTPRDFSQGVLDSLDLVAERLGLTTEALLRRTARLALGTTVGTNALLQRRGARVGLITTRGHRDVIHIMRGARGVPGLASEKVLHFPESNKPDPHRPQDPHRRGERARRLQGRRGRRAERGGSRGGHPNGSWPRGVEAIAICFLWSFKHPEHERRVKAMVERLAPGRLRLLLGRSGSRAGASTSARRRP